MSLLRSLHTEFFRLPHPFLAIQMHATDAKTQKIEPESKHFYDGRKFGRQCVNVIANSRSFLFFNMQKIWCAMTFKSKNYSVHKS